MTQEVDMKSISFDRKSAIELLCTTMSGQVYRDEVQPFVEYQKRHYTWVQSSADVHTDQPAIIQLVACLIDDPQLREEYRRVQTELERLCEVADLCDKRRSLESVRRKMLGDRQMRSFEDGSIGVESSSAQSDEPLDVGEPPPLPGSAS